MKYALAYNRVLNLRVWTSSKVRSTSNYFSDIETDDVMDPLIFACSGLIGENGKLREGIEPCGWAMLFNLFSLILQSLIPFTFSFSVSFYGIFLFVISHGYLVLVLCGVVIEVVLWVKVVPWSELLCCGLKLYHEVNYYVVGWSCVIKWSVVLLVSHIYITLCHHAHFTSTIWKLGGELFC